MNFIYSTPLNSFTTLTEDTQIGVKALDRYSLAHIKRRGNNRHML